MLFQRHRAAMPWISTAQALKADPAWVPAQLGLARAFEDDDPKASQAAFDAAKELAPESPDVWLMTADRAISAENYDAAAEALDHAAKSRAGSMDEAVMRVTLAYQKHDTALVDAAIARVHEIDPRSGAGYRAAGDAAAQKYRFDDAAEFAGRRSRSIRMTPTRRPTWART